MQESNEHSPLAGETWGEATMQEKHGIPRALALLWRGACLRGPRCGVRSLFRTSLSGRNGGILNVKAFHLTTQWLVRYLRKRPDTVGHPPSTENCTSHYRSHPSTQVHGNRPLAPLPPVFRHSTRCWPSMDVEIPARPPRKEKPWSTVGDVYRQPWILPPQRPARVRDAALDRCPPAGATRGRPHMGLPC